jgi:SsrA-binding protein
MNRKTESKNRTVTVNRRARKDYSILKTFEAGMVLTGSEVKSIRQGNVNLKDSYVGIRNGEAFLFNAHVAEYRNSSYHNHDPERQRKLLLHRKEIRKIDKQVKGKGSTVIPLKMYFNPRGRIKLEIAIAKGKREYEKKQAIKERDIKRDMQRQLKEYK